jgi:hypothetical protein
MLSEAHWHATFENSDEEDDDEAPVIGFENMLDFYSRGNGMLGSARTHEDVAVLVLKHREFDARGCDFGVYTLVCRNEYSDVNELVARVAQFREAIPTGKVNRLRQAVNSDFVYYVGQSRNIVDRLHSHINARGESTTALFPPVRLESSEWYDSEREARRAERERADDLAEEHPHAYVGGGR